MSNNNNSQPQRQSGRAKRPSSRALGNDGIQTITQPAPKPRKVKKAARKKLNAAASVEASLDPLPSASSTLGVDTDAGVDSRSTLVVAGPITNTNGAGDSQNGNSAAAAAEESPQDDGTPGGAVAKPNISLSSVLVGAINAVNAINALNTINNTLPGADTDTDSLNSLNLGPTGAPSPVTAALEDTTLVSIANSSAGGTQNVPSPRSLSPVVEDDDEQQAHAAMVPPKQPLFSGEDDDDPALDDDAPYDLESPVPSPRRPQPQPRTPPLFAGAAAVIVHPVLNDDASHDEESSVPAPTRPRPRPRTAPLFPGAAAIVVRREFYPPPKKAEYSTSAPPHNNSSKGGRSLVQDQDIHEDEGSVLKDASGRTGLRGGSVESGGALEIDFDITTDNNRIEDPPIELLDAHEFFEFTELDFDNPDVSSVNGKGSQDDDEAQDRGDDMDGVGVEEEENADNSAPENARLKPGPISKPVQEALLKLHSEYIANIKQLAKENNQSEQVFRHFLGLLITQPRRLNGWNAFLAWFREKSPAKYKGLPRTESGHSARYTFREEYLLFLGPGINDSEIREERLAPIRTWYAGHLERYLMRRNADGKMTTLIGKSLDPVIKLCTKIWEDTGLHVFGYAINPERDQNGGSSSMAWGSTQQFLELRNQYDNVLCRSLRDFEGLFIAMDVKNATESNTPFKVNWDPNLGEKSKDRDGRVLRECLRLDMWILKPGATVTEFNSSRFPWSTFLDQAWRLKQCLIGWPSGVHPVHITKLSRDELSRIVTLRRKFEDGKCTDEQEINAVVRVVGWSEENKALDLLGSGNVPLVTDSQRGVVHIAAESQAYKNEYEKATSAKTKSANKGKARSKSKIPPPQLPRTPSPVAPRSPVDDNHSPFPPPMPPCYYIAHDSAPDEGDAFDYSNGEDDNHSQVGDFSGGYYDDTQEEYNHEQNSSTNLADYDDSREPPSSPSRSESPVDNSGSPQHYDATGDLDMGDSRAYVRPSVLGGTMAPRNRTPPSSRQGSVPTEPLRPAGTSRQPSSSKKMPHPSLPIQRLSGLLAEPRHSLQPDTRFLPIPASDPTPPLRTYQSRHKSSLNDSQQLHVPPRHSHDEGHTQQRRAQTPDHRKTSHSSKDRAQTQLSTRSVSQAPSSSRSNSSMPPPQLPPRSQPLHEPPRKVLPLPRPHPDRSTFDEARRKKRKIEHVNVASSSERPSPSPHCPPLQRPPSSPGHGLPSHHPTPSQLTPSLSQHQSIAPRRQPTPLQHQSTSSQCQPTSSQHQSASRQPALPQHQPGRSQHIITASESRRQPTPSIPSPQQPPSSKRGRDN
ncbi:hypothetical protein BDN72DRAFT_904702 [Pluteus cervinus]|uniref:Uncharacterized protein n=1 Tax=Pluteus cervinus TaxID=181527 RepID=A0ACD3A622_9AGAR|nr:hypothetical protein BDN72DRAFT_904702 [Pluteus cervinus]